MMRLKWLAAIWLFGASVALAQSAPVLFFSDLNWGPTTGWEGSSTKGAAVTIWGKNFGATRGTNYVTVNGANVNSGDYAEWDVVGPARGLERITFYLNSSMANGSGTISVTVNGVTSNTLPFLITTGTIYFISIADGNNSNNGLYSTQGSGSNGPFRDLWKFNPCGASDPTHTPGSCNPSGDGQYIVYVRGGTYTTLEAQTSVFIALRGPYGGPTKRKALIGYPGETATINSTAATYGIIWISVGDYGFVDCLTMAKLYGTGGTIAISSGGNYNRIIGNTFKDYLVNTWAGVVGISAAQYNDVYGNMFDHDGYDSYKHNIYIKTQNQYMASIPPGRDYSTQNINVGWNEFQNATSGTDNRGGVIYISKSADAAVVNMPTTNIFTFSNYFHDGNMDFIAVGDGTPIGDVYVYNNIFVGATSSNGGVGFGLGSTSNYLWNNTFYQAEAMTGSAAGAQWWQQFYNTIHSHSKNNVYYGFGSGICYYVEGGGAGSTLDSANDVYYNCTQPTTSSGLTITGAVTGDPMFTNAAIRDFSIQSNSSARDAGVSSVSAIVTQDYMGIVRPQGSAYDIGAFEYASGTLPRPAPPTNLTAVVH